MCFQNFIIYTCKHTKPGLVEPCLDPGPTCGPAAFPPAFCLYVKQKCDACRRVNEQAWRDKMQEFARAREVRRKMEWMLMMGKNVEIEHRSETTENKREKVMEERKEVEEEAGEGKKAEEAKIEIDRQGVTELVNGYQWERIGGLGICFGL